MLHINNSRAVLGFLPRFGFHFRFHPQAVLGAEMALAFVLAFYHLAHRSFWIDETLTVAIVKLDWKSMWDLMAHSEANMGVYYLIMDVWVKFGDSEFYLRSLSVIFAIACIPATYLLATRLFNVRVGLIAGLVMATNAFWLHYAQEARAYSLALLLSILVTYLFVQAVYQPSWRRWLVFGAAGALAIYTHLFTSLYVGALFVSLAFLPRQEVRWRMVFSSATLMGVLLLPMAAFVLSTDGQLDFIPPLTAEQVVKLFSRLAGGRYILLPYFAACSVAAFAALRQWMREGPSIDSWKWSLILSGLMLPIGVALAVSLAKPVIVPRFFIICLTPLVLLVSLGLSQLRNPKSLVAALGLIVVVSLAADSGYYSAPKQEWRQVTSYILASGSQDDAVVFFHPSTRLAFDYYLTQFDKESKAPRVEHYAFESGTPEAERNPLELGFGQPPEPDRALGDRLADDYDRVWLVLSINHDAGRDRHLDEDTDLIMDALSKRYVVMQELHYDGIDLLLYARADAEAYRQPTSLP